jgi:hypothetical protein
MKHAFAMTIAAALAVAFLLSAPTRASIFMGAPSVRMISDDKFEIRWIADFIGDGRVDLFTNPDAAGLTVVGTTPSANTDHTVDFTVGGILTPDTTYYFKVTHTDPTGIRGDLTNDPPPFPPVFTGVQAIGGVSIVPGMNTALLSWNANVIGLGTVEYGLTSLYGSTAGDTLNITDHGIELTGLLPATTYQFRVSNLHAIEGDAMASETGFFTTLGAGSVIPEPSSLLVWAGLALVGCGIHAKTSRKRA